MLKLIDKLSLMVGTALLAIIALIAVLVGLAYITLYFPNEVAYVIAGAVVLYTLYLLGKRLERKAQRGENMPTWLAASNPLLNKLQKRAWRSFK